MQQPYWNWQALVSGSFNDLRALTEGKQSHYLIFMGGVDDWLDCPSDNFSVSSIYFRDEDDSASVSQVGYELLSLFNGASALFDPTYHKLQLVGLACGGHQQRFEERNARSGLLRRPDITDSKFQEFLRDAKAHDIRTFLLMLATENEDVYQVLKYFDMSLDWVTYYKVLETLEAHARSANIDLGLDAAERKAFTNTANNYSLSGFDSRHGFKELVKANKTPGMSLERAHQFVAKAARLYIHMKYGSAGTLAP